MTRLRRPIIGMTQVMLTALFLAFSPGNFAQAQESTVTAFVNVSVIPMDSERILENYTVLVEGETIATIGPAAKVAVPAGAKIIEGEGKYLMPGLADMHAHLILDPSPDFMRLFLAAGTTTLRNLNALPIHLKWREEVLNGERVGPTIYTSGEMIVGPPDMSFVWIFRALIIGPLLLAGGVLWVIVWLWLRLRGDRERAHQIRRTLVPGAAALILLGVIVIWTKVIPINAFTSRQYPQAYLPDTVERARAEVRRQIEAGYDLIKVYDWMTRDEYLGAISEAKSLGMYVIGHLDHGIEDPLASGLREIAHVDEFLDAHLLEEISPRDFKPVPMNLDLIPQSVESVVRHDAMVVSNMVTDVLTYEYLEQGPSYFERSEYHDIRPSTIQQWLGSRMIKWQGQQEWRRNTLQPFYEQMIRSLHAAGVPILTATDTGVEGGVPSHIHRDLELLVRAGLSPYEALTAATRNAAVSVRRMGVDDRFGEVVAGQRADLILLRSNPLEDVGATRDRIGVMSRGRWYTQAELDKLVAEVVATY